MAGSSDSMVTGRLTDGDRLPGGQLSPDTLRVEAKAVDNGLISSHHPDDLDAFSARIIEEVKEDLHKRTRKAA